MWNVSFLKPCIHTIRVFKNFGARAGYSTFPGNRPRAFGTHFTLKLFSRSRGDGKKKSNKGFFILSQRIIWDQLRYTPCSFLQTLFDKWTVSVVSVVPEIYTWSQRAIKNKIRKLFLSTPVPRRDLVILSFHITRPTHGQNPRLKKFSEIFKVKLLRRTFQPCFPVDNQITASIHYFLELI